MLLKPICAKVHLHLVDVNRKLVEAWKVAFAEFPEVTILHGDLLEVAEHCVVSPANSYGFMDGGIDAAYRDFFGKEIEQRVMSKIKVRPEGTLPVGASLVVRTGHSKIPYLIVAPTMTIPETVGSENCYRAMRAMLRIVNSHPEAGEKIFCPGLATGVGRVPASDAAERMAAAFRDWMKR